MAIRTVSAIHIMLSFTKMHSLGNDFVVIFRDDQQFRLTQDEAKSIADRNLGIGCDQILLVNPIDLQRICLHFKFTTTMAPNPHNVETVRAVSHDFFTIVELSVVRNSY